MNILRLLILALTAICSNISFASCSSDEDGLNNQQESNKLKITAYINSNLVNNQRDTECVKHADRIYFFGIAPDDNGEFTVSDHYLWALNFIRSKTTSSQEFLMVIGTGGSAGRMHLMGDDPVKRKAYVKKAVEFAKNNGFNGIDIDWETNWRVTPYKYVDTENLKALFAELREEMPKDWLLTTALGSGQYDANQAKEVIDMVDGINIMLYDIMSPEGLHAPTSLVVERLKNFDKLQIPHNKLLIGVPFYGRNTNKETLAYRNIIDNLPQNDTHTSIWNGYSFNSISVLKEKIDYATQNKYEGMMIWELSHDVPYSDSRSLLRSMNEYINKK